jgi:lysophospholipase L1-like esterase
MSNRSFVSLLLGTARIFLSLLEGLALCVTNLACSARLNVPQSQLGAAAADPVASPEAADLAVPRSVEQPWMSLKEWRARHDAQLAAPGREQAALAFVGDSIIQMWADTDAYREFASYRPLNLGIGGDQTQHVLWRLEHGSLKGTAPRLVVVLIGVNNLGNGHTPEATTRGVLTVVGAVRQQTPKAKVILLGILPSAELPSDPMRKKIVETNRLLSSSPLPEGVTFRDVGERLLEPDGRIATATMADGLHPTPHGFAILTQAVLPLIQQSLADTQ